MATTMAAGITGVTDVTQLLNLLSQARGETYVPTIPTTTPSIVTEVMPTASAAAVAAEPMSTARAENVKKAAEALVPLFDRFLEDDTLELELKFGYFQCSLDGSNPKFMAGVDKTHLYRILDMLRSYAKWHIGEVEEQTTDRYFSGTNVRCTQYHNAPMELHFMEKQNLQHINIQIPNRNYGVRVSLNRELALGGKPEYISSVAQMIHVRTKHRFSFQTTSGYRFDISLVSWGKDDSSATNLSYEIEIECVDRDYVRMKGCLYAAMSLLEKAIDFMSPLDPTLGIPQLNVAH